MQMQYGVHEIHAKNRLTRSSSAHLIFQHYTTRTIMKAVIEDFLKHTVFIAVKAVDWKNWLDRICIFGEMRPFVHFPTMWRWTIPQSSKMLLEITELQCFHSKNIQRFTKSRFAVTNKALERNDQQTTFWKFTTWGHAFTAKAKALKRKNGKQTTFQRLNISRLTVTVCALNKKNPPIPILSDTNERSTRKTQRRTANRTGLPDNNQRGTRRMQKRKACRTDQTHTKQ